VDGVDPDVGLGQLVGEALHDPDDAVLAGHVGGEEGQALEPGGGAGHHDRAAAGCEQVGDGQGGRVPHAGEVGVQRVDPDLGRDLVPPPRDADAGGGHHDVESPELLDAPVEHGLDRVAVADVGLRGHDPPVERLDLLDRVLQVLRGWRAGRAGWAPARTGRRR
jgi:hypothetical protein